MDTLDAEGARQALKPMPRLVFATSELEFAAASYEGFPLLLDASRWPLEPAHSFLWHTLVDSGVEVKLTWEAYGRWLYDYFSYLAANGLKWDAPFVQGTPSVVQTYKDWSLRECRLDGATTVKQRVRLVVRFYEWTLKEGLITALPFRYR